MVLGAAGAGVATCARPPRFSSVWGVSLPLGGHRKCLTEHPRASLSWGWCSNGGKREDLAPVGSDARGRALHMGGVSHHPARARARTGRCRAWSTSGPRPRRAGEAPTGGPFRWETGGRERARFGATSPTGAGSGRTRCAAAGAILARSRAAGGFGAGGSGLWWGESGRRAISTPRASRKAAHRQSSRGSGRERLRPPAGRRRLQSSPALNRRPG